MKKRTYIQIQKIKIMYFLRGFSLSRANNAELSQGNKSKFLRKIQKKVMLEDVVDPNMRTTYGGYVM